MADARIRPATESDLPAILELMRASLGEGMPREQAFFDWKHTLNPFGRSLVLLAEDDAGLVGLRAMMRWRFRAGRRVVHAVRPVDTATHPRFRRRGLFTRLTRAVLATLADEGVDLVFNTPNDQSRPGYLKMGWLEVGRTSIWVRPGGAFLPAIRRVRGEIVPHVCPRVEDRRLHTDIDPDYLYWRYTCAPRLGYRGARDGGCSVIFRTRERFGRSELTVTQVLCERGGIPRCARLLRRVVRSGSETHAIAMAAVGTRESAVLALAGFLPLPGRGPTLVTRPVAGRQVPLEPTALSSWRLQVGDLEVF